MKTQLERLAEYVRYAADYLRLKDWHFHVAVDETLNESLATIDCVPNRMLATICVGPLFFTVDPAEQRHGIVHELIHCHLQRARTHFDSLADHHGESHPIHRRNHDDHLESGVDALAGALAWALLDPEAFARLAPSKRTASRDARRPIPHG